MTKIWLLLPALLCSTAFGDWTKVKSSEFPIPPPPTIGSFAYEQDFALLHHYQAIRLEAECKLSRRQEHPSFDRLFESLDILTEEEKRAARPIAEKMIKLADRVSAYHKGKFLRPRPYDVDTTLKPCAVKPGGSRAYPSSHAANSAAGACVLALFYPQKAEEIIQYGDYLGKLRVITGVHHPSDVKAGTELGKTICHWAKGQPDFAEELVR